MPNYKQSQMAIGWDHREAESCQRHA